MIYFLVLAKCFICDSDFEMKFNRSWGINSSWHYWNYWTSDWNYEIEREKEETERGMKICLDCLIKSWINKNFKIINQIKNKKKRQLLAGYAYRYGRKKF